jgi:hypothetical protein
MVSIRQAKKRYCSLSRIGPLLRGTIDHLPITVEADGSAARDALPHATNPRNANIVTNRRILAFRLNYQPLSFEA